MQQELANDHKKTRLSVVSRGRVELKPCFVANLAQEPSAPAYAHIGAMLQQQAQQVFFIAKVIKYQISLV
jgi:hypothetical protein